MTISQVFEELQGWNLEFKLIITKSITGTYLDTMVATLDFVKRPDTWLFIAKNSCRIGDKFWEKIRKKCRKILEKIWKSGWNWDQIGSASWFCPAFPYFNKIIKKEAKSSKLPEFWDKFGTILAKIQNRGQNPNIWYHKQPWPYISCLNSYRAENKNLS